MNAAPPVTEAQWQRLVIAAAAALGWHVYHTRDSRGSHAGWPDLALCRERLLLAELKTDTGRVRPDQHAWHAWLAAAGHPVHVWRPRDWPSVEGELRAHRVAP